jgi:hypothetical protein
MTTCKICKGTITGRGKTAIYCKECRKLKTKLQSNKYSTRRMKEKWRTDPEFRRKMKQKTAEWHKKHPEKHEEYAKKRHMLKLIEQMDKLGITPETQEALIMDGDMLTKREQELGNNLNIKKLRKTYPELPSHYPRLRCYYCGIQVKLNDYENHLAYHHSNLPWKERQFHSTLQCPLCHKRLKIREAYQHFNRKHELKEWVRDDKPLIIKFTKQPLYENPSFPAKTVKKKRSRKKNFTEKEVTQAIRKLPNYVKPKHKAEPPAGGESKNAPIKPGKTGNHGLHEHPRSEKAPRHSRSGINAYHSKPRYRSTRRNPRAYKR